MHTDTDSQRDPTFLKLRNIIYFQIFLVGSLILLIVYAILGMFPFTCNDMMTFYRNRLNCNTLQYIIYN